MLIKSNTFVFLFALIALTLLSSAAIAQNPPEQSPEERARISLHNRVIGIVNAMTARSNDEGAEFNKRLAQMNTANPLVTSHLDSTGITANVPLVLEFLQYLKEIHHSSDSLEQAFNDSLFSINADLPADEADESIKQIGETFNEDRTAFNNFLSALDKAYAKVLDALLFLQHTHYSILKDQLSFSSKESFTEYSKLMKSVDEANTALNKANEALRKANAKANAKVKDN